jgi:hypothetical protein
MSLSQYPLHTISIPVNLLDFLKKRIVFVDSSLDGTDHDKTTKTLQQNVGRSILKRRRIHSHKHSTRLFFQHKKSAKFMYRSEAEERNWVAGRVNKIYT